MAHVAPLVLLDQTELGHRSTANFPVSCPTLNLSASWDAEDRNLLVHRPPSQIVSKIHQSATPGNKAPEALLVRWRPDGHFLAVAWDDGVVRLMGLENNKAAHHVQICSPKETRIAHVGWANCQISDRATKPLPMQLPDGLKGTLELDGEQKVADLPRELTFLEVDTALPKISSLPSGSAGSGEDALVFTMRSGIEFLFQNLKPEDHDQVNVMIVGTTDGRLHLSIFNSFVIGVFPSPLQSISKDSVLTQHAFRSKVSTEVLLFASPPPGRNSVHLVPVDLPFISSSPINLSLLASKLTTLQSLLRYIKQTQLHMVVEWQNTKELPRRFLRGVEGDLGNMETGPRGVIPALFHLAVTGHAHAPVREWLLESIADRGHKRWDKAVVAGLEGLRSLVHENFLPALDRCSIILSRLRGLALFHDNRGDIGFSVTQISRVMDIVSCLTLLGHKILVGVMDELEHFRAFSAWMRFQIDRLESSGSSFDDIAEKEATMDHSKVLLYLEKFLASSPVDMFFNEISKEDQATDWSHLEGGPSLLDILDQQLKKREAGQPGMKAVTQVEFLVQYLDSRSGRILSDIAEAKKRSVRFGKTIELSIGHPIRTMDLHMCEWKSGGALVFTVLTSKDEDSKVYIFRTGLEIVNGISTNEPVSACCIDLGNCKIIDTKFLNDSTLVVACNDTDAVPVFLPLSYQSGGIQYSPYETGRLPPAAPLAQGLGTWYGLPEEWTMKPVQMEAHERVDVRGELPARMSLLDSNRSTIRTFEVPES